MLILKTKSQKLSRVVFAPDGRGLAAAGQRGAYYWPSAFDDPKPVQHGGAECGGVGFTPDGEYLVHLPDQLGVCAVHLNSAASEYGSATQRASSLGVCPSTGLAVVEHWSGSPTSGWRVGADGTPARVWTAEAEHGCTGASVAFAPDGSWFVRAARDFESRVSKYRLVLYDLATGKEIRSIRGDAWVSAGPAVSPDKTWIAYANGSWLRVQSVTNERLRETVVNDNTHQYTGLAFHPSGNYLAVTNNDETVKLFDTATWKLARTFKWNIGKMRSICFSADGTLAAAGSDKGKVVVWDVDL